MTIYVNRSCTEIVISDPLLEDYTSGSPTVTAVTLKYKINGGEEVTYNVLVGDVDVDTITLTPTFFNIATSSLTKGIYCFTLSFIQGSDEITQREITIVDCDLICKVATATWNNPESLIYAKYEAIKLYAQCNACDCSTVILLYNDLLNTLDGTILNNDCGC
jgi:hypothetical protein